MTGFRSGGVDPRDLSRSIYAKLNQSPRLDWLSPPLFTSSAPVEIVTICSRRLHRRFVDENKASRARLQPPHKFTTRCLLMMIGGIRCIEKRRFAPLVIRLTRGLIQKSDTITIELSVQFRAKIDSAFCRNLLEKDVQIMLAIHNLLKCLQRNVRLQNATRSKFASTGHSSGWEAHLNTVITPRSGECSIDKPNQMIN